MIRRRREEMKASSIQIDNNISLLLKGPWGFGKTLAAATFALDGPVYLAYLDKKQPIELISYFSRFGSKGKKILDNIEYDIYGAENANEYLNKVIRTAKDPRYFAFITDSFTNLTSASVNWSLSFRDDRKNKDKLKVIPDWDEYKVETSMVTQALDLFRTMPCYVIWTAHPISSTKIEGSGNSLKVSKVVRLVSYGNKVGDMSPGNFSEIYHFSKQSNWDGSSGKSSTRYIVSTDAIGDDFAKSNLGLTGDIDITDGLFYEIWKEKVKQHNKEMQDALSQQKENSSNPFKSNQTTEEPTQTQTKWRV
jgi:hypothetical protein